MKKIFSLFICVVCLLSVGCVNKEGTSNSNNDVLHDDNSVTYTDILTNQNMIYRETSIYDDTGIYFLSQNYDGSHSIKFLDPVSMTCSYLCSQLGCNHNSEECTSYVEPFNGCAFLAKVNESIVVINMGNNDTIPPSVRRMSLSGGDGKQVVEFGMEQRLMTGINPVLINGEKSIYCELETTQTEGNGEVGTKKELIGINTETGEVRKILTFQPGQILDGAINNKFIITEYTTGQIKIYLATQDGNLGDPIYTFKGKGYFLENDEQMYIWSYSDQKLYKLSEDGQVTEYMDIPFGGNNSYIRRIYDDMVIVDDGVFNNDKNDWDKIKYCIDLITKEIRKNTMEIDNDGKILAPFIYGINRDYVVTIVGYTYEEETGFDQDGNIFTYTVDTPVLGKFTFDDFFSDRMIYQTFENI